MLVLGEKAAHLAPVACAVRVLLRRDFKIVVDVRTLPIPKDENSDVPPKARGFWWKLRAGFPFADAWMAITTRLRDAVRQRINTRELPCLIWESGVDPKFLDYEGSSPAAERIRACGHGINVLYLGSLSKGRRIDLPVRAMSELDNESAYVGLHIVGSGEHAPDLKQVVAQLRLSRTVHIWDPVPYAEVPAVIQACDVGILPLPNCDAGNTSSALKLYEYMGVGTPLLLSNVPAHRHAVGGQPFAHFMNNYSTSGYNEALTRFIRSPKDACVEFGKQARAFVRENHTFHHRAGAIHHFLTRLLAGQA